MCKKKKGDENPTCVRLTQGVFFILPRLYICEYFYHIIRHVCIFFWTTCVFFSVFILQYNAHKIRKPGGEPHSKRTHPTEDSSQKRISPVLLQRSVYSQVSTRRLSRFHEKVMSPPFRSGDQLYYITLSEKLHRVYHDSYDRLVRCCQSIYPHFCLWLSKI